MKKAFAFLCAAWLAAVPTFALSETISGGTGGGGGGAITSADGAIVNLGSSTDTSSSNTLLGLMKLLNSTASGPIPAQAGWSSGTASVNIGGVSGVGPTKSAIVENPLLLGARVATAEPSTYGTDGQKIEVMATKSGKLVNMPYAIPELRWAATGSTTAGTATTFTGASNSTLKTYITAIQCGRSDAGTTPITVAINDAAGTPVLLTTLVLPNSGGGGGNNVSFPSPLVASATNPGITFTASSAVATLYCSAQGYFAP